MPDYNIQTRDIEEGASVLRDVLVTRNVQKNGQQTVDYSPGSTVGDLLVDGHAVAFALLRQQLQQVRARLSFRDLAKQPDDQGVRDAVDALLSNVFRSRDQGHFSKGTALLHFSQRADALIPRQTPFYRTAQLIFYVDSPTDVLVTASSMRPNTDASGAVIDWVAPVYLTAARTGSAYDVDPGRFLGVGRFSLYFTYAEHVAKFQFGRDLQTSTDAIATAQNAMALRALVNPRSNDSLLRGELFPTIETLLTVNYGDLEMQRDLATDPTRGLSLHVGGKSDLYVKLTTQEVVDRVTINTLSARADNLITVLRDASPPSGSFLTVGVVAGDVLRVTCPTLSDAPFSYVIEEVSADSLTVRSRVPFSVATEEEATVPALAYTVGNNYPEFDNKADVAATTGAVTSRRIKAFNRAMLPGGPVYRVKQVELLSPPAALAGYVNPTLNTVLFARRSNAPTLAPPTVGTPLTFLVETLNPSEGQSMRAVTMIEVGWPTVDLSGYELEVTYDTVAGLDAIDGYVVDPFNRTLGADPLIRGMHPLYLAFAVPYRTRTIPRSTGTPVPEDAALSVDEAAVVSSLVGYVRATPYGVQVDAGGLGTRARESSAAIAATYPFTISYELLAPNGQVYRFETEDVVTIDPDGTTSTARLTNPTDFDLPASGYYAELRRQLLNLGISDRTVSYFATEADVALDRRG